MVKNIKNIIDNILGSPKRDYGSNGWFEYNCPICAEHNGGRVDNKYNLAVSIDLDSENSFYCHCWKCEFRSSLSKLVKKFGTNLDIDEYINEITALKESKYFKLSDNISVTNFLNDDKLELPKGFKLINKNDKNSLNAYNYLINRGLNDKIIQDFNIGYIGQFQGKYSNRIVIPSYNIFGDLNYWVARDYTNQSKLKYLNPNIDKKSITFNEQMINWYEPITLVEGVFEHIVVPNSIPLLGKVIDDKSDVFRNILNRAQNYIYILLDDDATENAYKMYKFLNKELPNKIKIIECPKGYDPSDYYKIFGYKGILNLLKSAHKVDDFKLSQI